MHLKLTKHGRFFKQTNQLPTKSHDELKNNSITPMSLLVRKLVHMQWWPLP